MEHFNKIQEAAELAKQLNKGFKFTTTGDIGTGLKIYEADDYGNKIELTYEEFFREYKKLKRDGPFVSLNKPLGMESRSLMQTTGLVGVSTSIVKEPKGERQKKIQEVLSQTKKLAENLEGYLKALDQKGIFGEIRSNKK